MKPIPRARYAAVNISHEAHDALRELAHQRRETKKAIVEKMIDDETKKEKRNEVTSRR